MNIFEDKTWEDYEEGFGDLDGDKMWYGLKALNCFTETQQWELRIDFQFANQTWSYYLHYNCTVQGRKYKCRISTDY